MQQNSDMMPTENTVAQPVHYSKDKSTQCPGRSDVANVQLNVHATDEGNH